MHNYMNVCMWNYQFYILRISITIHSTVGSGPNCGLPGTPTNGDVIIIDTIPESEVRYTCNDGFELIGNERRRCGNNEKWNGRVPECHSKIYIHSSFRLSIHPSIQPPFHPSIHPSIHSLIH